MDPSNHQPFSHSRTRSPPHTIINPPSFTHHNRTQPSIANNSSRTSQSGSAFAAPFLLNARSAITAAIAAAAAGSGRIAQCQPAAAAPAAPAAAAVAAAAAAPSAAAAAAAAAVAAEIHPSVHEPPPSSTIGFAEELVPPVPPAGSPGAGEGGAGAAEKVEPRLTVASITKSLIAGGVAGGVSRSAVAPLERMKILLQVQNAQHAQYSGTWQGLKTIWREEGIRGLFRGNGTNCARIVPNSAVKFFAYEEAAHGLLWLAQQQSNDPNLELTPVLRLGAGATAGIIAMSATYPMDMVRGRLTVQSGRSGEQRYKGMRHAAVTIVKEEGVRALYRGWLPSVIGVVPYVGLNFAVYETLKDQLGRMYAAQHPDNPEMGELSVLTKLACGAVAGTLGQTVAYPLDVIRRRLQMVGWRDAASVVRADGTVAAAPQYTGMVDAFRKTVQMEGVRALYKGLVPNSVKVVPSIAIAFVTYEIMRDLLHVEIRISD
ncbi:unnamed protein product [Closterium sp. NIES-53]